MPDSVEPNYFADRRDARNECAQMARELLARLIYIRTGNARSTAEEITNAIDSLDPELRHRLLVTIDQGEPVERTDAAVSEYSDCLLPPDHPDAEPTLRFEEPHG